MYNPWLDGVKYINFMWKFTRTDRRVGDSKREQMNLSGPKATPRGPGRYIYTCVKVAD